MRLTASERVHGIVLTRNRFLHARILLFRPILSRFCLPQETPTDPGTALDESLPQRMALQCSALCLRAAHDAIDLIYANLVVNGALGPLPAWWYCVLCEHSSVSLR